MRWCKPHKPASWDKCGQPGKTPASISASCELTHEDYLAAQDGTVNWSGGSGGAAKLHLTPFSEP